MRFLIQYVVSNRHQAILVMTVFGAVSIFFVPFGVISAAVGALVTLRKNPQEGLLVFVFSAIIIMIVQSFIIPRPGMEVPIALFLYIPVWLSARALYRLASQGDSLVVITTCCVLLAMSIQLYTGDAVSWWGQWLELATHSIQGATIEGFEEDGSLYIINGLVAVMLGLTSMMALLLARYLQSYQYNPGGFQSEFYNLSIPRSVFMAAIVILSIGYMISELLIYDLLVILTMMYAFQGLAIFHFNIAKKGYSHGFLVPVYLLLMIYPQHMFTGLAMLGVFDIIMNFRQVSKVPPRR
jgi:hypothetical protein